MGYRCGVDVSDVGESQPWRLVRSDPYSDDPRLVACDSVVCQCRAVLVSVDDLAVRHESELDESLESVADTAHESVPVVEEVCYSILDLSVAEECSDEFCRTIRLVSA